MSAPCGQSCTYGASVCPHGHGLVTGSTSSAGWAQDYGRGCCPFCATEAVGIPYASQEVAT